MKIINQLMKNTVIFDMDGVIVDTEPLHKKAYYQHFKELDIDVDAELFSRFTGKSTRNVYQMIKEIFGIDTNVEELIQRKRTLFYDLFDSDPALKLLDGVEVLIKNLYSAKTAQTESKPPTLQKSSVLVTKARIAKIRITKLQT